jgi:esterase
MTLLHSQIMGEGSPFLILHGFLGMGDNWKSMANAFSEQGHQVHLVDQRNHGRSFHSDQFSYKWMAEDLKEYCDHYQLDEIILLGHSMGGKTAMQFATTYPSRVSKLIIADIAPKNYPQHHQDILKGLSSLDFNVITSRGEADEILSKYIPHFGTRQFLLKNLYWESKERLGLRINLPVLMDQIEEIGAAIAEEATFEGDTIFIKGAKSDYIQPLDDVLIHKHFPKAQIITVSKAGHWLHADNPSEFYDKIMAFLNGIDEI